MQISKNEKRKGILNVFFSFYEQINTETFKAHVGRLGMWQRVCLCECVFVRVCVECVCAYMTLHISM